MDRATRKQMDEKDLIALSLGDLPPERVAALQSQLDNNSPFSAETDALRKLHALLKGTTMPVDQSILDRSWDAVRPALNPHHVASTAGLRPSWRPSFLAGVLVGGVSVGIIGLGLYSHQRHLTQVDLSRSTLVEPSGASASMPQRNENRSLYAEAAVTPNIDAIKRSVATQAAGEQKRSLMKVVPAWENSQDWPKAASSPTLRPLPGAVNNPNVQAATTSPESVQVMDSGVADVQTQLNASTGPHKLPARARSPHGSIETTLAFGAGALLTAKQSTLEGQVPGTQTLATSNTYLLSFRQSFKPWLGYTLHAGLKGSIEENAGKTRSLVIPVNMYEVSTAYTVQKHVRPDISMSAELGGGVLFFQPSGSATLTPSPLPRPLGLQELGLTIN